MKVPTFLMTMQWIIGGIDMPRVQTSVVGQTQNSRILRMDNLVLAIKPPGF